MAQLVNPEIDFSPLASLGTLYKQGKIEDGRRDALSLSNLGEPGGYQKAISSLAALGDFDGAAKVAAIQKSIAPESSADIQAFKMAQGQGFQGGILDFLKQKAEAGAARTNVNTNIQSGEKEFDKAVGKDYGETFVDINKKARDSVGALGNLTLMEKLVNNPDFYSGTGGQTATTIKKGLVALGIKDADTAAPNELFQKLSQKTVLDAAGGSLGTGFSNADRDFLQGTVANISNTPEGNRQIIAVAKAVENRKQQVAQLARDYAKAHGGRIDAGFDQNLAQWATQNPVFNAGNSPASVQPNKTKSGVTWSVVP